jgi:hypothetical protein
MVESKVRIKGIIPGSCGESIFNGIENSENINVVRAIIVIENGSVNHKILHNYYAPFLVQPIKVGIGVEHFLDNVKQKLLANFQRNIGSRGYAVPVTLDIVNDYSFNVVGDVTDVSRRYFVVTNGGDAGSKFLHTVSFLV